MRRKEFIRNCTLLWAITPICGLTFQSCGSIYYASSTITDNTIQVSKKEFLKEGEPNPQFRNFVLVQNKIEGFPICIYRNSDDQYFASLMKCTHRGCEVNVGGGILSCPCHGSEFTMEGNLLQGPAESNLQSYQTKKDENNLYIFLG